jgi:AAA15 family ATPase/GTPase
MKLINFSYQDPYLELNDFSLDEVSLLVGKNSSGKTRTLNTIDLLVKMITQKKSLSRGAKWNATFKTFNEDIIDFSFATSLAEGGVNAEKIQINGVVVLLRSRDGSVELTNKLTGGKDVVYPPQNKLTFHTNRDVKKYPYLEEIVSWAEQSYGFKFGNISPYLRLDIQEYDLLTAVEDIPSLFTQLKAGSKENLLADFNEIGYKIETIRVQENNQTPILFFKEAHVENAIPHYRISQGMFRALSMIIFLEYLIVRKKPTTIIIDDLCEGLDYERATKLGKLVFRKCLDNDIQLIATSNDSFLMEVVDVKYWNILRREGKKIESINHANYPEVFEKFRFTGLSNFDLFSSDFLQQQHV